MVPAVRAEPVITAAEEITAVEDGIRESVAAGGRLVDIRERLRYHDLQSRNGAT